MFHSKWEEKMYEKNWEEMQKYKEFKKENFKGVDKFSSIFGRIFNFFRFSIVGIFIVLLLGLSIIFILFTVSMKSNYVGYNPKINYEIQIALNR